MKIKLQEVPNHEHLREATFREGNRSVIGRQLYVLSPFPYQYWTHNGKPRPLENQKGEPYRESSPRKVTNENQ